MKQLAEKLRKIGFSILEFIRKPFSGFGLKEYYIVRWVYNFLFVRLKPNYVRVDGNTIYLDELDTLGLLNQDDYERFVANLIKKELHPGDTFLDLGAHIGYHSLLAANIVGENGRVFSFEPDPSIFAVLKKNRDLNNCHNVTLERKGVADVTGTAKLFLYGPLVNSLGEGIHDPKHFYTPKYLNSNEKTKSIEIPIVALDDYFKDYERNIDFIKMDIEGAEARALKGMRSILSKNKNIKLITEFAPVALRKASNIDPADYLRELVSLGFNLFEIHPPSKGLRQVNISELTKEYTPTDGVCTGTNIFCTRS